MQQLGRTLHPAVLCSALLPGGPTASCCTLLPCSPPKAPKYISVAPGGAGMGSIKLFLISFLFLLQSPGTGLLQPLQPNDGIIQLYDTASIFLPSTAKSKWHCRALRVVLGGGDCSHPIFICGNDGFGTTHVLQHHQAWVGYSSALCHMHPNLWLAHPPSTTGTASSPTLQGDSGKFGHFASRVKCLSISLQTWLCTRNCIHLEPCTFLTAAHTAVHTYSSACPTSTWLCVGVCEGVGSQACCGGAGV